MNPPAPVTRTRSANALHLERTDEARRTLHPARAHHRRRRTLPMITATHPSCRGAFGCLEQLDDKRRVDHQRGFDTIAAEQEHIGVELLDSALFGSVKIQRDL